MAARIALIAALADNNVIGMAGALPWRVKADLRKFRALTMGKPLVMGRKTFQSITRALDGRDVIVVTRQSDFAPAGVFVARDLDGALKLAEQRAAARGVDEICVVGGGEIYRTALPLADCLYLTHISGKPDGDASFPEISAGDWQAISSERLPESEGDTASAEHVIYARRR